MTVLALSLIFVITTVGVSTYQEATNDSYELWKSSSLPVLIALDSELYRSLGGMTKFSETEEKLMIVNVHLHENAANGNLPLYPDIGKNKFQD